MEILDLIIYELYTFHTLDIISSFALSYFLYKSLFVHTHMDFADLYGNLKFPSVFLYTYLTKYIYRINVYIVYAI